MGQSEVEALARQILYEQRQLHALKRLDFSIDIQTGRVSVETPQLSFCVTISLDPEQLKQYRLRVEITAFKSMTALEDSTLLDSLSPYCHSRRLRAPALMFLRSLTQLSQLKTYALF